MQLSRRWIRAVAGFILGGIFLYFALRGTNWSRVFFYIKIVPAINLFYALMFLFIHFFIRAYRWKFISESVGKLSFASSFTAIMLGYFFNMILPFRLGEIVKVSVTTRKNRQIPFTSGVGFLIIERGMDLLSLLFIFVLILPYIHISDEIREKLLHLLYFLLMLFVILTIMARWIKIPEDDVSGLKGKFYSFIYGIKVLGGLRRLFIVVLLSLLLWPWSALYYHVLLQGTGVNLNFIVSLLLPIVVGMGVALPSAPGFIGTYEYFVILVLGFYSVPHDQAVASALVIHFWQYIIIVITGILLLIKEGSINFKELEKE